MIRYYKTIEDKLEKLNSYEHGCWVNLVEPTNEEIFELSNILDLDIDSINAALDEEERSRIEVEDNHTLVIIDIPIDESSSSSAHYSTIPLGIILMDECIVTVCTAQSRLLNDFIVGHIKEFFTYKKTRFILQILYKNATYYLLYLRRINKLTIEIEREIHNSMKNKEIINNNQNNVMQFLTVVTFIFSIPTIVSGFFGMNVINLPFENDPYGFWIILLITTVICLILTVLLSKNKLL